MQQGMSWQVELVVLHAGWMLIEEEEGSEPRRKVISRGANSSANHNTIQPSITSLIRNIFMWELPR